MCRSPKPSTSRWTTTRRPPDHIGVSRALGIDTLIVGGIVTNGGVASTLRDAHLRNIDTVMLTDGCAAFRDEVHEATLVSLGTVTRQMTCAEALEMIGAVGRRWYPTYFRSCADLLHERGAMLLQAIVVDDRGHAETFLGHFHQAVT